MNAQGQPLATPAAVPYPVNLEIPQQVEYNRFLPIVKGFLLIPHFVALIFVSIAALFVYIAAFFAVLFTRRYPEGMFNFLVGLHRWSLRVTAYLLLMTDQYPPFALADDPSYPVRFTVDYPGEIDRWRPLLAPILAYPVTIVGGVLVEIALVILFVPFFAILFTRRYPQGLFEFTRGALRLQARGGAYGGFMVTVYPPFDLS